MNFELKIPPPMVVVIFALTMWVAAALFPAFGFTFSGSRIIAFVFASAGFIIASMGTREFRKAQTTTNPTNPAAATSLVTSGIYKRSRNPMYTGLLFILTGWAIYLSHALSIALLPAFVAYMTRFQILPEERALASSFGTAYREYKQTVRRWV